MSENSEIISIMEKAWNEVPENIKNAAPDCFPSATILTQSSLDYVSHQVPLKNLHGFLTSTGTTSASNAEKIVDQCIEKFPQISEHRGDLISALQCPQIAEKILTMCVEECMRKSAAAALALGFALSVIGLVFEAVKLQLFWEEIKEARIFLKDDFDQKKESIQAKIEKLPGKSKAFTEDIQEPQFISKNSPQRVAFILRKTRERDAMRSLIGNIRAEIGDLKVRVDGKLENFGSGRSSLNAAALNRTEKSIALGVNLPEFGAASSPIFAFAKSATIIANGTGASKMQVNKQFGIGELRGKLDEVEKIRSLIVQLQNSLIGLFEEFNDILET